MENREWLKSLTDEQLAEEIHYGRMLAETSRHKNHARQELAEALDEQKRREGSVHD